MNIIKEHWSSGCVSFALPNYLALGGELGVTEVTINGTHYDKLSDHEEFKKALSIQATNGEDCGIPAGHYFAKIGNLSKCRWALYCDGIHWFHCNCRQFNNEPIIIEHVPIELGVIFSQITEVDFKPIQITTKPLAPKVDFNKIDWWSGEFPVLRAHGPFDHMFNKDLNRWSSLPCPVCKESMTGLAICKKCGFKEPEAQR